MVLEATVPVARPSGDDPVPEALIEEARRVRRRRRRRSVGYALVIALAGIVVGLAAVIGGSGGAGHNGAVGPGRPSSAAVAPGQTAPAGDGIVGRGPTAIDFSDAEVGWIASGGGTNDQGLLVNPTIVATANGGTTWTRVPVPDLAGRTVNPAVYRSLGGLVGIHFATPVRGWYFQAGLGWQTNDDGATWTAMRVPHQGELVALTTSGHDVWMLVDRCAVGIVSCPQGVGRAQLYHADEAARLSWSPVGAPLPAGTAGDATLYSASRRGVVIASGDETFVRELGGSAKEGAKTGSGCAPVGALADRRLAGVCDTGGGGNASATVLSVSDDDGARWSPLLGGPPSSQFEGELSTNGADAVFYVTGGQTLWRTGTNGPGWTAVLQVPSTSTDEIAPIFVRGSLGLALVSDGLDPHWFESTDAGVTWRAIALP